MTILKRYDIIHILKLINNASLVLVVKRRFCNPNSGVRFSHGAPIFILKNLPSGTKVAKIQHTKGLTCDEQLVTVTHIATVA